ncbi:MULTISPECIES: DUF2934 domain-containing protein [unclassified Variovorax]|uniref:DUF2934 domain-containing protein n=1 Tax=unclassified Variovorax TaxID=663243 RepID=UPI0008B95A23|nr:MULTISPECIES: DUF2934 domain-containing protein [unclassified Variovorax]SEK17114.1 Protein of unknown function [Variovorax sp. OK202]SFE72628.1 Protein of unknown function [Variovorax sp. OK212]
MSSKPVTSSGDEALSGVGTGTGTGDDSASVNAETGSREEAIRRAANARYERRGGGAGHEAEGWLEAEAEIAGRAPGKP